MRRLAVLALLPALLLGACARVPRLGSPESVRVSHARGVAERTERLAAMRADGRVQIDGRATGRLPALIAQTTLAGDAGFRLRARWLLGAAADVVLRGDSLLVWVPAERLAFSLAGAGETLGVGQAGTWVARALGAAWMPPAEAWRTASAESGVWRLAWRQGADSLSLRVNGEGEPVEAEIRRDGRGVLARYEDWRLAEGVRWPHRVELRDRDGWLSCTLTFDAPSFPAQVRPEWLDLRVPGDARRIHWDELRRWLDDLGLGG